MDAGGGIYGENTLFHDERLFLSDGVFQRVNLAVDIGKGNIVAVNQHEFSDAAARQSFHDERADAADTENGDFSLGKFWMLSMPSSSSLRLKRFSINTSRYFLLLKLKRKKREIIRFIFRFRLHEIRQFKSSSAGFFGCGAAFLSVVFAVVSAGFSLSGTLSAKSVAMIVARILSPSSSLTTVPNMMFTSGLVCSYIYLVASLTS